MAPPDRRDGPEVDVLVLTRDGAGPRASVRAALAAQEGVRARLHVVPGPPRDDDPNRWATIARARNAARRVGTAPLVLFLDDDVVLGPGCLAALVDGLRRRPDHAAVAADYLGESAGDGGPTRHVAMGATLFRRDVLAFLQFRWEPGRCECQCACDDLRAHDFGIAYEPNARAHHEPARSTAPAPRPSPTPAAAPAPPPATAPPGAAAPVVLAAFDRGHAGRFLRQFLPTLRASGNGEAVAAVGYGLGPADRRRIAAAPGVTLFAQPDDGVTPALRRLRDFPTALESLPSGTPAAYWDAGDVVFQGALGPLWTAVRSHPGRLLVAREPLGFPDNGAVTAWTLSIRDPDARLRAFHLLSNHPYFNGGFAAGTADALIAYFREADRLIHSPALAGSADWGDQTALNLYCHTDPARYREVSQGWNYCLCHRPASDYRIDPDGRLAAADGTPVRVVHGNAASYREAELSYLHRMTAFDE